VILTRKHSSTFLWLDAVFRFSSAFFQLWDSHLQCKELAKNDLQAFYFTYKNIGPIIIRTKKRSKYLHFSINLNTSNVANFLYEALVKILLEIRNNLMEFFLFSRQCIWCFQSQMCIYLFCTFVLAMFGQSVWNCCPTFVLGIAMFITAVCVLFLIKLRWPKKKSVWDKKCSKIKPKFYTSNVFCLYFYLFIHLFTQISNM